MDTTLEAHGVQIKVNHGWQRHGLRWSTHLEVTANGETIASTQTRKRAAMAEGAFLGTDGETHTVRVEAFRERTFDPPYHYSVHIDGRCERCDARAKLANCYRRSFMNAAALILCGIPFVLLLAFAGPYLSRGKNPLQISYVYSSPAYARALLAMGFDANGGAAREYTPLCWAVKHGQPQALQVLMDHGADLNAKSGPYDQTPLMFAARCGNESAVQTLIARGADIEATDMGGKTALHHAVSGGAACLQHLLATGTPVDAQNCRGYSPLLCACLLANCVSDTSPDPPAALAQLLLDNGADPNLAPSQGVTPLMVAVELRSHDLVALLLAEGAEPNVQTRNAITPLHRAALCSGEEMIELLTAHGAEVNAAYADGLTPLDWALEADNEEAASALRAHGAVCGKPTPADHA